MFGEWRQAMERRGLKVNLEKTNMMETGGRWRIFCRWGGFCVECVVAVLELTVQCRTCGKWCHRKRSGLRSLSAAAVAHFQCPACARGCAEGAGVVGEVKQFSYLGDRMDCGGLRKEQ